MEEWTEVEQKGIKWLVSRDGKIKSVDHETNYTRVRNGKKQVFTSKFKGKDLAQVKTKNGYLEVSSMKHGRRVRCLVHRLIGLAYVPGFEEGLTINHKDGNKTNNAPENLEWVSLKRNTEHQWEFGLVNLRGENAPSSKLTSKQVVYIRRLLASGVPAHTLAIISGMSQAEVAFIRDGERWPEITGGFPVNSGDDSEQAWM